MKLKKPWFSLPHPQSHILTGIPRVALLVSNALNTNEPTYLFNIPMAPCRGHYLSCSNFYVYVAIFRPRESDLCSLLRVGHLNGGNRQTNISSYSINCPFSWLCACFPPPRKSSVKFPSSSSELQRALISGVFDF